MSKAVMISIQPKWCELIANGRKTVEIRKTRPKLDAPFKCYIYCTNGKNEALWRYRGEYYYDRQFPNERPDKANGKVIGEFVCDFIDEVNSPFYIKLYGSCLSAVELVEYSQGGPLYGWHISDLQIYDTPKELSEFWKPCRTNAACYPENCSQCVWDTLTRPPQSWRYVEDI